MKPVRDAVMRKPLYSSVDKIFKEHANSKSCDVVWLAMGRPTISAVWNMTLTPSRIFNLGSDQA